MKQTITSGRWFGIQGGKSLLTIDTVGIACWVYIRTFYNMMDIVIGSVLYTFEERFSQVSNNLLDKTSYCVLKTVITSYYIFFFFLLLHTHASWTFLWIQIVDYFFFTIKFKKIACTILHNLNLCYFHFCLYLLKWGCREQISGVKVTIYNSH